MAIAQARYSLYRHLHRPPSYFTQEKRKFTKHCQQLVSPSGVGKILDIEQLERY